MGLNPNNYNFGMQFNPADFGIGNALGSVGNAVSSFNPIAAGANLLGSVVGGAFDIWKQNRQWKKQEEMYNKYQSPAAQMEQMVSAGINPNAAAAGIAGNGAGQSMSPVSTNSIGADLGAQIGNSYNSGLNAASIQAMTQQSAAQTSLIKSQAKGQLLDNAIKEVDLGMRPDLINAEIEEKRQHAAEMAQNISNLKKEYDKYQSEIDKLKEEKETIIQERGLIEYEKEYKAAQTAAERAKANLDNVTAGIAESDPYYRYYKAVEKYGDPDHPECKSILKEIENTEYSKGYGQSTAKVNAEFGHTGMVGQTIDAVRRFVGAGSDYGIKDVLSGFGLYIDNNGFPQFKPVVNLFNRISRPSYSTWKTEMTKKIRTSQDNLINSYRAGKMSKDEYTTARKALDEMLKNGLTQESYNKTFGKR